jgi:hypothetical protein
VAQAVFPGQWLNYPLDCLCIFLSGFFHVFTASRFVVDRYRYRVAVIIDALF